MTNLEQKQNGWLEPMSEWIKVASSLEKTARDTDLFEKKVIAKEIFGSNLRLASRAVRGEPQNQWAAVAAAHKMASEKSESQILERVNGIEPSSSSWKEEVLPLNYTRIKINDDLFALHSLIGRGTGI
jgi:hypothetical protein